MHKGVIELSGPCTKVDPLRQPLYGSPFMAAPLRRIEWPLYTSGPFICTIKGPINGLFTSYWPLYWPLYAVPFCVALLRGPFLINLVECGCSSADPPAETPNCRPATGAAFYARLAGQSVLPWLSSPLFCPTPGGQTHTTAANGPFFQAPVIIINGWEHSERECPLIPS
jgi:hypothetical protein